MSAFRTSTHITLKVNQHIFYVFKIMNILRFPLTKKCKIYTKQFPLTKKLKL